MLDRMTPEAREARVDLCEIMLRADSIGDHDTADLAVLLSIVTPEEWPDYFDDSECPDA